MLRKLKKEVEEKGLKLSITEDGKEGKSKRITSCRYGQGRVDMRFVCPRDVKKMLLKQVRTTYHLAKNDYRFDALQIYCFGFNIKL